MTRLITSVLLVHLAAALMAAISVTHQGSGGANGGMVPKANREVVLLHVQRARAKRYLSNLKAAQECCVGMAASCLSVLQVKYHGHEMTCPLIKAMLPLTARTCMVQPARSFQSNLQA